MKHRFYVLCGENGLLIKGSYVPYYALQEMLHRYMRGRRYIKGCASLDEAQVYAYEFALRRTPPIYLCPLPKESEMVRFRDKAGLINPIEFFREE